MNHSYEFRGKGSVGNDWYYGLTVLPWDNGIWTLVAPSEDTFWSEMGVKGYTVGQYTGIQDKNNVKIYEGDLIRFEQPNENETESIIEGVIMFERAGFVCVRRLSKDVDFESFSLYEMFCRILDGKGSIEVIGNMFDNRDEYKRILSGD